MSKPFTIPQTDINTMCSQLKLDLDILPQIDVQDDENADTNCKTQPTILSLLFLCKPNNQNVTRNPPLDSLPLGARYAQLSMSL